MLSSKTYEYPKSGNFKEKAINWIGKFDVACVLDSHAKEYPTQNFGYRNYNLLIAVGSTQEISSLHNQTLGDLDSKKNANKWKFGFFSYDLKNRFENLESNNLDGLNWPEFYFFVPKILLLIRDKDIEITCLDNKFKTNIVFDEILASPAYTDPLETIPIKPRLSKEKYIEQVEALRRHIRRGDIYEVNFCQEFYGTTPFDPYNSYTKLDTISPTPFSSFFKLNQKYLLAASPERFLKRKGNTLISQPIKGTSPRSKDPDEDLKNKVSLRGSIKERAENIMIVDLVRNDLAKIAKKSSVKVEELCGIYSFRQVHQMISTIRAEDQSYSIEEIIRATFPMGSMTGAPKVSAMKLAEEYESTKRGLFSGAVGYIAPNGDFDLNVVIRGIQYNAENNYLSCLVGSAITYLSEAEKEYEECLIKASSMMRVLKS